MFDRNVKLQFNEMKYAKQINNKVSVNKIFVGRREVLFARTIFFILGFCATSSIMNTDIQKYKGLKGIVRWRHRIENVTFIYTVIIWSSSWT